MAKPKRKKSAPLARRRAATVVTPPVRKRAATVVVAPPPPPPPVRKRASTTPVVVAVPAAAVAVVEASAKVTAKHEPKPPRIAEIPGAVVIADKNGVTEAGKRAAIPGAKRAVPPPVVVESDPTNEVRDCYIRLPVKVNAARATEWARKVAYQLGTAVEVWRVKGDAKPVKVVGFDKGDEEDTKMRIKLFEAVRFQNTPWHPVIPDVRETTGLVEPSARFTPPPGAPAPSAAPGRVRRSTSAETNGASAARSSSSSGPKTTGKGAEVVKLMLRKGGASVAEIQAITGWGFSRTYVLRLSITHKLKLLELGDKQWGMK